MRPASLRTPPSSTTRLAVLFAIAATATVFASCVDESSPPVGPVTPMFDLTALASVSAMGIGARDLGAANISGTGAEVCNSAPVRGPNEPGGGGSSRTWLGEKVKNPTRTFVAGGVLFTLSADKQSLSWTSVAAGNYAGTSNVVTAVLVKAATNSAVYYYNPNFSTDADGAPPNAGTLSTNPNDNIIRADAGLSALQQNIGHVVVCYVERIFLPSISLALAGKELAGVGEPVEYTIMLANTSAPATRNLDCTVTGDLGLVTFASLVPGETRTEVRSRSIQPTDPDPYVPAISASCGMAGLTDIVPAEATATTNVYQVSIEVTLTVDPPDATRTVGDAVVYTAGVKNTSSPDSPSLFCDVHDVVAGINSSIPVGAGTIRLLTASYTIQAADVSPLKNTFTADCKIPIAPFTNTASGSASVETVIIGDPLPARIGGTN